MSAGLSLVCETAARYGTDTLEDASLLATFLNGRGDATERAKKALAAVGGIKGLAVISCMDLASIGLTELERLRIEAAFELARRSTRATDPVRITSPRSAGDYLLPRAQGWTEERFGLLALNARGTLLAERILSQGVATATLISPREFFREALRFGATTALAFHNHPSGDPTPSPEDIKMTHRLRAAGESLGVPLADHIVLGCDKYHSFRAAEGWDNRL